VAALLWKEYLTSRGTIHEPVIAPLGLCIKT
jgi:hypothetical protein